MRYLVMTLAAASMAGAGAAQAVTFDASYISDHELDTGLVSSGFGAGVSQGLGEYFFVGANYSQLRTASLDDGSISGRFQYKSAELDLGAGAVFWQHIGLSASAGYAGSETRGLAGFEDDPVRRVHGPVGGLTLSVQPNENICLLAGPSYSYVGRVPGWQRSAGLRLGLARTLWLNISYWNGKIMEGWSAGFSKDFGSN